MRAQALFSPKPCLTANRPTVCFCNPHSQRQLHPTNAHECPRMHTNGRPGDEPIVLAAMSKRAVSRRGTSRHFHRLLNPWPRVAYLRLFLPSVTCLDTQQSLVSLSILKGNLPKPPFQPGTLERTSSSVSCYCCHLPDCYPNASPLQLRPVSPSHPLTVSPSLRLCAQTCSPAALQSAILNSIASYPVEPSNPTT